MLSFDEFVKIYLLEPIKSPICARQTKSLKLKCMLQRHKMI